jgi:HSP20 family protein
VRGERCSAETPGDNWHHALRRVKTLRCGRCNHALSGASDGRRAASAAAKESAMNDLRINDPFALEPMEDLFRGFMRPWRTEMTPRVPQIKLDLSETEGSFVIKADVPGVRKEDIDVRIDGNQVTIGAEMKKESDEKKDGRVIRSERHYGYASRVFTLSSAVDEARAEARMQDGVLQLTLPKKTTSSSRRLPVA